MKIIAINGSPRGKKGVTYLMVEEFLRGAKEQGADVEHVLLSEMRIHHCVGCFTCWTETPGVCVFKDDMQKIPFWDSDLILYATPLYVDNVSGLLKNFMDRSISVGLGGQQRGCPKMMVVANCGFPGQENFDVLRVLFSRLARSCHTELVAQIYRDEGPLLLHGTGFESTLDQYKQLLQRAGREVVKEGFLSDATKEELSRPLMPYDLYLQEQKAYFEQFSPKSPSSISP